MPTRDAGSASPGPTSFDGFVRRADALDVQQLWHTLRSHYRLILGIGFLVFAFVMSATLLSRMQFRSVGRLYLGELESSSHAQARAKEEIEISAGSQGIVGSEIEIIQSRSLVSKAILESGLNVAIASVGAEQPRYGKWLLSRRDPLLLDTASEELIAKSTLLTDERAQEQAYVLRFLGPEEYEVFREERSLGKGKLGEVLKVPGADLHFVAGKSKGPHRGSEYRILVRPLLEVIDGALKSLHVSAPKPTPQSPPVNVVTLEFKSGSPRTSALFLERLIAAYLTERQAWKVEDAAAAEAFVAEQLATVRRSLDDLQGKLATYRSNNRVVVLDNEAKAMIEQIGKYEEQRVAARLEVAALADVKRTLKGPNPPVGAFLVGEADDKVLEGMARSLSEARQKLTDLDTRFNEAAPEIRDQRAQVEAQLESIRNYVSSREARAQENLSALSGIIAQYEKRLQSVPGAELGLAQLSREAEVYSRTYSYLLERQQQTAIIKASTLSKNRVLDVPQPPLREDSPKLMLRLVSAPLGLLLGVVLVLARSFFAGTFQSEADARAVIGSAPLLATLPRRGRRRGQRARSFDVIGEEVDASFGEAFRTLRTKLYRAAGAETGKVLLISSASAEDGKTTCALGLAAMLAADGKRVLVIDADLRGDNQIKLYDETHPTPVGLREVLRGEEEWTNVVLPVQGGVGQFYVLPAGGPAPAELLSSRRMGELIADARQRCDFIIIDSPAFPRVGDALVLSSSVDVVLSVIRVGNTPRRASVEHLRGLQNAASLHAIVLNGVGESLPGPKHERSRRALVLEEQPAAPLRRWARGRTAAWWAAGLLLVISAAVTAASMSPRAVEVIGAAISFRHAG